MLKVNMEYHKGILFVRLTGKLNKDTSYKLDDFLIKLINRHQIKKMIYNLDNLYSIDSIGDKLLKKGIQAIKKNKGNVLICSNSITTNIKEKYSDLLTINELVAINTLM